MVSSTAVCHGAATIVNAIGNGKGAAFGIKLETKATVELKSSKSITEMGSGLDKGPGSKKGMSLVELCVKKTLEYFKHEEYGAVVRTETNIPTARGLKSSSVVANAVVLATVGCLAKLYGGIKGMRLPGGITRQQITVDGSIVNPNDLVLIGVNAAREAGVTVTGALDDAGAAYFGGFVVTDNTRDKIMQKGEVEDCEVIILSPDSRTYTKDVDVERTKLFEKEINAVWNMAYSGDIYPAITMNGLVYSAAFGLDTVPVSLALEAGAVSCGLSGTGPAIVALAKTKEIADNIESVWKSLGGEIIRTKTNNQMARIIE